MSIVVGYRPQERRTGALDLARGFAESSGLALVVCCVVPDRWQPVSPARATDSDYGAYLQGLAKDALNAARDVLQGCRAEVTYDIVTARSASSGLLQSASAHEGQILVVGSSSDGRWGHIALGTVADRLMHSSPIPVAVPPRGEHWAPGQRVTRLTVAADGTEGTHALLARAAAVAGQVGAVMRAVTFAIRPGKMYPPVVSPRIEDEIVERWRVGAKAELESAAAGIDPEPEQRIIDGTDWEDALSFLDWDDGDVLVVGSSSDQPLASRVFLGSTAARILRHSPVPVVVVP